MYRWTSAVDHTSMGLPCPAVDMRALYSGQCKRPVLSLPSDMGIPFEMRVPAYWDWWKRRLRNRMQEVKGRMAYVRSVLVIWDKW